MVCHVLLPKGGYPLKGPNENDFVKFHIYSFFNDLRIQCSQFLSQKIILRGCWGHTVSPKFGNTAVISASYIITVIKNLLLEPSWQVLDAVRGRGDSGSFSLQPVVVLMPLLLCLGSPERAELLCNTVPHVTGRSFLQRSFQYGASHSSEVTSNHSKTDRWDLHR